LKKEKLPPGWVLSCLAAMVAVQRVKKIKMGMALFNFLWIFVLPHIYYGYFTKTLHFNLIFWPKI
jgi:hypothetical protein